MVITEKWNHFKSNTFIKTIDGKPEQCLRCRNELFLQKNVRILNVKNQASTKTKRTFVNQYSCSGVVMNSFLQFCL